MRKWVWISIVAVVLALVVVGGAVWYVVFRDDAPPAVSLSRATDALDDRAARANTPSDRDTTSLDGTWTVDDSIGSFTDFSSSYAGFRVEEQLAGIGAKTAVGRTPRVTGSMDLQGTMIPRARFEVDMTTLTTDDGRRDNAIRTQAIETSRFPTASFTLTRPITLASVPSDGEKVDIQATGDLVLHGVTKQVTFPLQAQRKGDVIAVIGSLEVPFSDYSISKPTAAAVLSVEDKGVIEVQLFFTKAA